MLNLFIYNKYFVKRNNFPEIGSVLYVHHFKKQTERNGTGTFYCINSG